MLPTRLLRRAYLRSGIREHLPHPVKVAARGIWARVARRIGYPIHSPLLAPPARPARRRPLRLSHVLLASDLNPRYLQCWKLARRAWPAIAGLEPVLVLVADPADVPEDLRADPQVRVFPALPELHTAFQAQCIRLLYPTLLEVPGAVLISDMELMPLDARYFHGPLAGLDDSLFVAYRDVHLRRREIPIAYNAAAPATWRDLVRVDDESGVAARLREWGGRVAYEGVRGGAGWYTDQRVLHDLLLDGSRDTRLWLLDDQFTRHRRLERADDVAAAPVLRDVARRRYTDFDALVPHDRFRELNEQVVETAIRAHGG